MFIAMNRFRIVNGHEDEFEEVWRSRDSHLKDVPGFVEFRLLKGPETDEITLYAVAHHLEGSRGLRGLDQVRAFPQGACERGQQQPSLQGPPGVRRLRKRDRGVSLDVFRPSGRVGALHDLLHLAGKLLEGEGF